jgi:hypothetical protein
MSMTFLFLVVNRRRSDIGVQAFSRGRVTGMCNHPKKSIKKHPQYGKIEKCHECGAWNIPRRGWVRGPS